MTFKHPLARDARVWVTTGVKGKPQPILVIVTTLELNEDHKKFKADKVQALSDAAKEWIDGHATEAADILLINRPKDWTDAKD